MAYRAAASHATAFRGKVATMTSLGIGLLLTVGAAGIAVERPTCGVKVSTIDMTADDGSQADCYAGRGFGVKSFGLSTKAGTCSYFGQRDALGSCVGSPESLAQRALSTAGWASADPARRQELALKYTREVMPRAPFLPVDDPAPESSVTDDGNIRVVVWTKNVYAQRPAIYEVEYGENGEVVKLTVDKPQFDRKLVWSLVLLAVLLVGGGVGHFYYRRRRREASESLWTRQHQLMVAVGAGRGMEPGERAFSGDWEGATVHAAIQDGETDESDELVVRVRLESDAAALGRHAVDVLADAWTWMMPGAVRNGALELRFPAPESTAAVTGAITTTIAHARALDQAAAGVRDRLAGAAVTEPIALAILTGCFPHAPETEAACRAALDAPDPGHRVDAARALREVPILLEIAREAGPSVADRAVDSVFALGAEADRRAAALVALRREQMASSLRALDHLGPPGNPDVEAALLTRLTDHRADLVDAVVLALCVHGGRDSVQPLQAAAERGDVEGIESAIIAIQGRLSGPESGGLALAGGAGGDLSLADGGDLSLANPDE